VRQLGLLALITVGCKPAPDAGSGSEHATRAEPFVIADREPEPSAIVFDDTYVYWNNWGRGLVRRAPRAGGPAVTLYESNSEVGGRSIALAGDQIYFDEGGFNIVRIPKAGGAPTVIGHAGQVPMRMTADTSGAYIAAGEINAFPAAGGIRTLGGDTELWDIATDATHVYWIGRHGVNRVAKTGGPIEHLAVGAFRFCRIAVDDTNVYFGDAVLEAIFAVPKTGGRSRYIAHAWSIAAHALVPDRGALWVMASSGTLQRVDPRTGKMTVIASNLQRGGDADHSYGIAPAGDSVYVATGGMSMSGTGLRVIDLTGNPDAPPPPTMTHSGQILRVASAAPADAVTTDESEPQIAMVWFQGASTAMQDGGNAVRWIDELELGIVPDVKAGRVGLHLIAEVDGPVTETIARKRASAVESAIREKLGGSPKITIATAPPHGYHGHVEVALDRDDLATVMMPTSK
jgi:streptogramin lyase